MLSSVAHLIGRDGPTATWETDRQINSSAQIRIERKGWLGFWSLLRFAMLQVPSIELFSLYGVCLARLEGFRRHS